MADLETALRRYFERAAPRGVVAGYLFGSHAAGRPHRESDVDVAVLFDYARLPDRVARAREAVRLNAEVVGATHVNAVDLVALNDAPPELAATIVRDGRRVYCTDPALDAAFRRKALSRYADIRPFLERTRRVKLEAIRS
jgi:predicted nucleotidyltransferase